MILMNILLISKFFLIIAFAIFTLAALRLVTNREVSNAIIGADAATVSVSVILVSLGSIYGIGFFKDIALALVFLGVVGTIAFATVLRRD